MSDLDWTNMPDWVMFTATNMTGQINGYEEEPIYSHGAWGSSCMRFCHLTTVEPPDRPGKTLIKRPIKKEGRVIKEPKDIKVTLELSAADCGHLVMGLNQAISNSIMVADAYSRMHPGELPDGDPEEVIEYEALRDKIKEGIAKGYKVERTECPECKGDCCVVPGGLFVETCRSCKGEGVVS